MGGSVFKIKESQGSFLGSNATGKEWEVVLIEAGLSANGVFYSADVLREAVPLFEGSKACAYNYGEDFDHLPKNVAKLHPEGFSKNTVGWFESVKFDRFDRPDGSTGEGIIGVFHVLEGAEWLRKNLRDAWEHGQKNLLGFSIDADGTAKEGMAEGQRARIVQKIESVDTTDVVTNPAAGGAILKLRASIKGDKMKNLYNLISDNRSTWLEGFAEPEAETDMNDYVINILESNLTQAEAESKGIPKEEVRYLAEVARGVNVLNQVLELIKGGKNEEAAQLLSGWIAKNPVDVKESKKGSSYSYPYKNANSGKASGGNKIVNKKSTHTNGGESMGKEIKEAEEAEEDVKKAEEEAKKKAEEKKLADEKEAALKARESALLVKEKLLECKLPEQAKGRLTKMFEGKIDFAESEVDEAIKTEGEYIASFKEQDSAVPTGLGDAHGEAGVKPADVKVIQESYDKKVDAFEGMLAGRMEKVNNIEPFSGLHQAFRECAGPKKFMTNEDIADVIFESLSLAFHGKDRHTWNQHAMGLRESLSKRGSRKLRESIETTDFPVAFGDAMFRRLQKEYAMPKLNDWREVVSSIENLKDATNSFHLVRTGGVGDLPTVNQNAPYQELDEPTEADETMTPSKKGGLLKFTWEDALADNLGVLRRIPRKLGQAAARSIRRAVWNLIENNTAMVSDGTALINSAHANRLFGDPALSYTAVTLAIEAMRKQTEQDSGTVLDITPAKLLVGIDQTTEAMEITDSAVKQTSNQDSTITNIVKNYGIKTLGTSEVGRASGTDEYWWLLADPKEVETIAVGFLGGRDRPDIFVQSPIDTPTSGAAFTADAITFKLRFVYAVAAADYRWIVGSLKA